jgi:hypothetical protein
MKPLSSFEPRTIICRSWLILLVQVAGHHWFLFFHQRESEVLKSDKEILLLPSRFQTQTLIARVVRSVKGHQLVAFSALRSRQSETWAGFPFELCNTKIDSPAT